MKGFVVNYRDFRDFNLREFLNYKALKESNKDVIRRKESGCDNQP
jgi:hypothetical protein